jgi:hypothetical protein
MSRVDAILSLQADLKDLVLPLTVIRAIQLVQESLAKSVAEPIASGNWKRVDWRGSKPPFQKFRGPASGGAGSGSGSGSGPGPSSSTAPHVKYTSRFKKTGEADDAVLMLIQDKLNKFSPKNYKEILEFLCQILDSGKTHFLKDFMKFVFQKATREESFCPYYAQLLCELTGKYKVLLTELVARYHAFGAIFEDISELETDSYAELLSSNSDKAYRQGYAQFLGELVKYNVLDKELFIATLTSIVHNIGKMSLNDKGKPVLDEYVICLTRIMESIKTESTGLAKDLRTYTKGRFVDSLEPLSLKNPALQGISTRSRFMIMNIVDMMKRF